MEGPSQPSSVCVSGSTAPRASEEQATPAWKYGGHLLLSKCLAYSGCDGTRLGQANTHMDLACACLGESWVKVFVRKSLDVELKSFINLLLCMGP